MGVSSPTSRRTLDARTPAILVLAATVALLLFYTTTQPADLRPANRVRMRLNLDTTSGGAASIEAEGEERQVADAVAMLADAAGLRGGQPGGNGEADGDGELERAALMAAQTLAEQEEQGESEEHAGLTAGPVVQRQEHQQAQQEEEQPAAVAGAAGQSQQQGQQQGGARSDEQKFRDFSAAVGACEDFDCLTQQATMEPGPGQFRFPHFYLIGFQKCATTSLFHHLIEHPQIEEPGNKEPEFFTQICNFNAMRCRKGNQLRYLRETLMFKRAARADFTTAGFEGSTHYALEGKWLAAQMIDLFPWLRFIVSMRDPISQAISMLQHSLEHKRMPACYDRPKKHIFRCINEDLDAESRYAASLRPWLQHVPRGQLHLIQYENLTSSEGMAPALRDVKTFLAIHPQKSGSDLGLFNFRHQRRHTDGWEMKRSEYLQLVQKARRNAEEVVEIVRQYGFADADAWMANWEAAWQANLDEHCEEGDEGTCMVHVT